MSQLEKMGQQGTQNGNKLSDRKKVSGSGHSRNEMTGVAP